MSELSGVRRDYIAQLERGATEIPRDPANLKLLAAALKVRLRDIAEPTGWYETEEPARDDWLAMLMSDARLDEDGKRTIERLVRLELEAAERETKSVDKSRKRRAG